MTATAYLAAPELRHFGDELIQAAEVSSGQASLTIHGQATDNASTFSSSKRDITSRPLTAASAAWDPAPWTTVGEAGPDQRTSNLAGVVQEIVNRPGWKSGNSLALIIRGSGLRTADSFKSAPAGSALLYVEYTVSSSEGVLQVQSATSSISHYLNVSRPPLTRAEIEGTGVRIFT